LSGGESDDSSFFLDASTDGSDVFIAHRGPLGEAGPLDDKVHLYDVRVRGGFPSTSLACTGSGCQGVPPAAPSFATPASVTFNGTGNFSPSSSIKSTTKALTRAQRLAKALKACKKKPKKKRATCQTQARKRYGAAKSKSKGNKNSKTGRK
jgi:hypothetical protein